MKKIIISLIILGLASAYLFAGKTNPYFRFSDKSKIENHEHGVINWAEGYFLAKATGELSKYTKRLIKERKTNERFEMNQLEKLMTQQAKENMLNMILSTKVDSYNYVRDFFNKSDEFRILFLEDLRTNIVVLPPVKIDSDKVEAVVKYSIFGKNSLSDLLYRLDDHVESFPETVRQDSIEPMDYTSIIIDLRSSFLFRDKVSERIDDFPTKIRFPRSLMDKIRYDSDDKVLIFRGQMTAEEKLNLITLSNSLSYRDAIESLFEKSKKTEGKITYTPSLFPTIYDNNGRIVYSKNMIEKARRSNIQYSKYTKDSLLFYKVEIVGKNPLYIIADKIKGENNTDIVINQEDADKIFFPKTIQHLRTGRIYFLVD